MADETAVIADQENPTLEEMEKYTKAGCYDTYADTRNTLEIEIEDFGGGVSQRMFDALGEFWKLADKAEDLASGHSVSAKADRIAKSLDDEGFESLIWKDLAFDAKEVANRQKSQES